MTILNEHQFKITGISSAGSILKKYRDEDFGDLKRILITGRLEWSKRVASQVLSLGGFGFGVVDYRLFDVNFLLFEIIVFMFDAICF